MSVKIMGLVWDLNNDEIDREEKYILLAYADHADHKGYNIFPAIATIAEKTGYKERAVQMITRSLVKKGYLVDDGKGSHGTNKWRIPLSERGAEIAPAFFAGVQNSVSGGAKPKPKRVQAHAPEPSLTEKQPSIKEASPDKPKGNEIQEVALYREVVGRYPAKASWHTVVKKIHEVSLRLGHQPTKDELFPFYEAWCNRGWLSTSVNWLDYAVRGELPSRGFVQGMVNKATAAVKQNASMETIHKWLDSARGGLEVIDGESV